MDLPKAWRRLSRAPGAFGGEVAGAAVLTALLLWAGRPPLLLALLLSTVLLLTPARRAAVAATATAVGLALVATSLVGLASDFAGALRRPPEFDFAAFWFHARLAVRGADFYDPERVPGLLASLGASPAFVELGRFWYPPQTMLLFLPLGFIRDPRYAWYGWSALQLGAAVASTLLLVRLGPRGRDLRTVVPIAAAVAALWATTATFHLGQTHFLLLLSLLAFAAGRDRFRGGFALGLAILVKPIALVVALESVLRRRRRALVALAVTAAASTLLAYAVFGAKLVSGYALRGAGPVPSELFRMPSNQSLLGLLVRRGWIAPEANPLADPLYLAPALLMIAAAAAVLIRRRARAPALEIAFLLAVALVVYPQTLDHYAVLLLPAIVTLSGRKELSARAVAVATPLLVAFSPLSPDFPAVLAAAGICAAAAARALILIEGGEATSEAAAVGRGSGPAAAS